MYFIIYNRLCKRSVISLLEVHHKEKKVWGGKVWRKTVHCTPQCSRWSEQISGTFIYCLGPTISRRIWETADIQDRYPKRPSTTTLLDNVNLKGLV